MILTCTITTSILVKNEGLQQIFILLVFHVLQEFVHLGVDLRDLRHSVQLFEFGFAIGMDCELCLEGDLHPLPQTVFVLGPINVPPNFDHELKVFKFWRVVFFGPGLLPYALEEILALLFASFKGVFVILHHLIEYKKSVVVVFGMNERPNPFVAILCELLVLHELQVSLSSQEYSLFAAFGVIGIR